MDLTYAMLAPEEAAANLLFCSGGVHQGTEDNGQGVQKCGLIMSQCRVRVKYQLQLVNNFSLKTSHTCS